MKAGLYKKKAGSDAFRFTMQAFAGIMLPIILAGSLICVMGRQTAQGADSSRLTDDSVERIMAVQEQLASLNRRIEKENLLAEQGPPSQKAARNNNVIRLQEIKFIYQRSLNSIKKNASLTTEEAKWEKSFESGEAYKLSEKKPYSLSYYDKLLDQAASIQQEKKMLQTSLAGVQAKLDQSKKELDKAERNWRLAKETISGTTKAAKQDDMAYNQAVLEKESATAVMQLQSTLLDGLQREMRLVEYIQKSAQQKLANIREDLSFDPDALDQEISRLQVLKNQQTVRLQLLLVEQKNIENQWKIDTNTANSSVTKSALAAIEAWREAYEAILQQTEEMTLLFNTQQRLWKSRYALVQGKGETKDLNVWVKDAQTEQQHAQQSIGLYQSWQWNQQAEMATLIEEKNTLDETAKKYADFHLQALNRTGEYGNEYFSQLLATGRLAGRLLDELTTRTKDVTWWEKAKDTGSKFHAVWNFELWAIDDNGVTVRKVVTAFFLFVIGIVVLKQALRFFFRRLKRSKMEAGAVIAMEKMLFYTAFVFIVLFTLRIVNIPLTIFSFFGGAIAIGVGFGAQNLINNFICGFIILVERPIRIGDLIEMDGRTARVEEIGARCTRVRTGSNIHILIPNSSFLENNITNWTFSDQKIRTQVVVGVAYGSPIEQVTELLEQAATQTEKILSDPKPFVIFDDFGDSALIFEIYFWAIVRGIIEKKRISSDLRYHINALLNANNISIAFPQQDIHVDSTHPIQVELQSGGSTQSPAP